MRRLVVLLRAVNVPGRKVSMADLRSGFEERCCTDVETYIQSGNMVLRPPEPAPDDLDGWLSQAVGAIAGFPVPVVLRTHDELRRTVARNPYPDDEGTLHVVFFAARPGPSVLDGVDLPSFAPEACTLVDRDLYLHLPHGMGRAKLPVALERAGSKADPPAIATARNWKTVRRLVELSATSPDRDEGGR